MPPRLSVTRRDSEIADDLVARATDIITDQMDDIFIEEPMPVFEPDSGSPNVPPKIFRAGGPMCAETKLDRSLC